jgi:hypothetical protein
MLLEQLFIKEPQEFERVIIPTPSTNEQESPGLSTHLSFRPSGTWTMSSSEDIKEKLEIVIDDSDEKHDNSLEDGSRPILHNGKPVITTGQDVSRFVVDIRDDGDTALTFRSMFLGTIFAGMGAALSQVSNFIFER